MYSVVLMMALSGGTQAVDCSCACTGTVVYSSCSGSCSGWGHGHASHGCCGGGGLFSFFRGHGCCGGGHSACTGCCGGNSYACSCSCSGSGHGHSSHGCCGGGGLFSFFRGHGCHGSSGCHGYAACTGCTGCTGYTACTGCTGCAGGVIVAPTAPTGAEPVKVLPKVEKKEESSAPAPAKIIVSLPANATLLVDGNKTTSTSATRTLVTPALEIGNSYVYNLRAEMDGQVITQQVTVRGGETTPVEFAFGTPGVATR
jgi:uncharacterized protein (TIGR03000 family)